MATRVFSKRLFPNSFARRGLLGLLVAALLLGGIQLRQWTWEETRHVRFQRDLVNGFYWGSQTLVEAAKLSPDAPDSWSAFFRGYVALYDRVKREAWDHNYLLDYPPLRLLAMSIWAKKVRKEFPGVDDGHPEYVEPLLDVNLICELVSALAIFFLVRLWVRRASGATNSHFLHRIPSSQRGWICGLMAGSVAWLEPSMILDAHGWPQWDVWILPFFLLAALAASTKRWFWCGALLATGAMLKGQLLLVTPFFVFWPLWQKRWVAALRVLTGFAAGAAFFVWPWVLRTQEAWTGIVVVAVASGAIIFSTDIRHKWAWLGGSVAFVAFVLGAFFGGSFAWLQIGFTYGSEHYPYLFVSSCYNLASLLDRLGWSLKDSFWSFELGARHVAVTPQWTLRLLYLGVLALCSLGVARHARNRDPRGLLAIAGPWLVMFAILGQMHERYLLWGAVVSAVALGVSVRLSLVHFILSLLSTAMIGHVMLIDKKLDPTLGVIDVLHAVRPYASGLVLACVAIWLWETFSTRSHAFQRAEEQSAIEEESGLTVVPATEEVLLSAKS